MLDRFLRPRWDSPRAQVRCQALLRLAEGDPLIDHMAAEDSEPWVRREAVARIVDISLLLDRAKRDLDASVREAAWDRLIIRLESPLTGDDDLSKRLQCLADVGLATVLTRILRSQADLRIKQAAVTCLQDEMHLEEIALHSSIASLRLAAAERIHSEALLRILAQESRNHDKSVYRIARDKLDVYEQQRKEAALKQNLIDELRTQITQHAAATLQPLYLPRAEYLEQRWQEHGIADTAVEAALQTIKARCQELKMHDQAHQRWAILEQQLQNSLQEQPDMDHLPLWISHMLGLQDEIQKLASLDSPHESHRQQRLEHLSRLENWWPKWQVVQARLAVQDQPSDRVQTFNELRLLLEQAPLKTTQALLQLTAMAPAAEPVPMETSNLEAPSELSDEAEIIDENASELNSLRERITRIERLIEDGRSLQAMKLWRRLSKQIPHDTHLRERLSLIDTALKSWQDWQSYAVLPKKQELLDHMLALISSDLTPEELWKADREARKNWRHLGVANAAQEHPMWLAFVKASEQVQARYQPWRDEQERLRQAFLRQAESLLGTLQPLATKDLDKTSWKQLRQTHTQALATWKELRPHLPAQHAIAEAIRAELDRLQQGLSREETANNLRMQELIRQAEALLAKTELKMQDRQELRNLQQQWKDLGLHRRRDNQILWPQFKTICDQIHDRLSQEKSDLAEKIKNLDASSADFPNALKQLQDEVTEVAPGLRHLIQERQKSFVQAERARKNAELKGRIDRLLSLLEGVDQGQHDLSELLAALPGSWRQNFQGLLPNHEEQRHEALLLWEAALDLPSPEDEMPRRRELMLQRWTRGQGTSNTSAENMIKLAQAALQPVPGSTMRATDRLRRCLEKSLSGA